MIDVTPFVETLKGKPVAVFGLGISNLAAIKALIKAGAKVTAWDDKESCREEAEKAKTGATLKDLAELDFSKFSCLVLAPGVPLYYPVPHLVVKKAQEAGLEILCDLEILHRCGHGRKTIGVTGTNGKSTTTALISHTLQECGIKNSVGGNIGKAVLDLTMPPKAGAFVFEISSFQLDLCPTFAPDIGVLLNLSTDHIDRHGDMDSYAKAKRRMFRGVGTAIISQDDEDCRNIALQVAGERERTIVPVSVHEALNDGLYAEDNVLYAARDGKADKVFDLDIKMLPGIHNHQNAACAYGVARALDLKDDAIHEAMKNFSGLDHRQYLVRVINGVAYVNDSKATNVDATARALACYKNTYWIVGGKPKEGGLEGLEPYLNHVKHAFLIGESMDSFASWLDNHGVAHNFSQTMDHAVDEAHRMAQSERGQPGGTGTVLLSPACASYDQFDNFEQRGHAFTALVNGLSEETA